MTIILDYDNDAIRIVSEKEKEMIVFKQINERILNLFKQILNETFNQIATEHDCAVCASMNLAQQNEGMITNIEMY